MSKQFKQIPQTLQGKLIAITAIEPGAGKSYSKVDRVKKLRADGYKVRSLGTTQIVSQDQTLCSYLRLYDNKTNEFKKYEDVRKLHPKTSAFIFIDEAWMMSQEYINALREDFPKCCFIIIGDPSQLEGVDTTTNGKSVINHVDLNIELQGSHRTSDERLLNFMHELKRGLINFDLLKDRIRPTSDKDMFITYTNEAKNSFNYFKEYYRADCKDEYFYSMKGETSDGKLKFHKSDKEWTDSWKNMELWKVTDISAIGEFSIKSITDDRTIANLPLDIFLKYFHNAASVNIHKVQGISLKDTTISLWPYDGNFPGSYRDVLRQLYVMVSRASSWNNIGISQEMYNILYKKFVKHLSCPLNFAIRASTTVTSTSEELCNLSNSDFINILQYTTSAVSPAGVTGVSLSQIVVNMSGITQTYASTNTTQICTNTTLIGTRKSGGRGHKSTSSLTRAQKENIVDYLKNHNGLFKPEWDEERIEYATNYVNNHKEKFMNTQRFDKYDEIINEDINKVDLINGNKQYGNYILSLRKQYNEIMDDINSSLNTPTPSSQKREELKKYLNSYSGKRGLHIVYVYENFNVNLAKNIVKGLEPEFVFNYDTFIVRNK